MEMLWMIIAGLSGGGFGCMKMNSPLEILDALQSIPGLPEGIAVFLQLCRDVGLKEGAKAWDAWSSQPLRMQKRGFRPSLVASSPVSFQSCDPVVAARH